MPKVPSTQDLALHGGRPLHGKPWSDGPYHYKAELKVMEEVLSGHAFLRPSDKNF